MSSRNHSSFQLCLLSIFARRVSNLQTCLNHSFDIGCRMSYGYSIDTASMKLNRRCKAMSTRRLLPGRPVSDLNMVSEHCYRSRCENLSASQYLQSELSASNLGEESVVQHWLSAACFGKKLTSWSPPSHHRLCEVKRRGRCGLVVRGFVVLRSSLFEIMRHISLVSD